MPRLAVRAAVLRAAAAPLKIETVYLDEPGRGEVLVRTRAVGLCHSDLKYVTGSLDITLPAVLGHEVAGVVERIGDGVTRLSVGDHVVATVTPSCGACAACVSGYPTQCQRVADLRRRDAPTMVDVDDNPVTTLGAVGAFAEAILVPESALAVVPPHLDSRFVCLLSCCVSTGVGAVVHGAKVTPADTVAVVGCGGVGMAAIQGSRIAGARRIIAVDMHLAKLELARSLGATDVVLASAADAHEQILRLCPGGVSQVFEAVGSQQTAEFAFSLLAPGGTATILGLTSPGSRISIDAQSLVEGDRRLQGAYMGGTRFLADIPVLTDHLDSGRLDVASMVTSTINLDQINEGFESMKLPTTIRTVIAFESPTEVSR